MINPEVVSSWPLFERQGKHRSICICNKKKMKQRALINDYLINPLECFFGSEVHVAQDIKVGLGNNTLLLRMIPGILLSACPHRQLHTLPGLLDSWAALSNSFLCAPSREAVCTIFMLSLRMTQPGCKPITYPMIGGHANYLMRYKRKSFNSSNQSFIVHTEKGFCIPCF